MKFILGKKLNMTQIWEGDKVVPVTPVAAGPCFVTQVKDEKTDGYFALQVGFDTKKEKNVKKPQRNHLAKSGHNNLKYVKELHLTAPIEAKIGDIITTETFAKGDIIDVIGVSKGKGFQGVVKRHGFSGHKHTHGNKDQERHSGSVGPKGPAHVFKGTRMGGQTGNEQVTAANLEIIEIDTPNNIIYVKGSVPGAVNSLIIIKGQGDLKFSTAVVPVIEVEVKTEEVVEAPVGEEATPEVKTEEVAPVVEKVKAEEVAPTEEKPEEVKE
ncbi:50S ribosomal protein L3 [Candidatus Falkowbacteria bacterium CG_4_10_14_0_2_um_filter_41_15]|uniref:Large ribosomal subunit protein uL3 n=1 Tax=Candidatus Falkowbacteria bacterium CG_4_10_14_0_2_um_filter_41_15 TaxID=1974554 RepID=A0A2M7W090_9BACT|nr:MAG: 50S ribosomal protein L3 [Candidatus Falkowbacteria bacterium CG_4_10_14_0_2_um_filter_41_15]